MENLDPCLNPDCDTQSDLRYAPSSDKLHLLVSTSGFLGDHAGEDTQHFVALRDLIGRHINVQALLL